MPPDIIAPLLNFGGLGVLVYYLMWRESQLQKERERKDADTLAYNKERLEFDKARLEVDRQMATNMGSLTEAIRQGTRNAND